jgi:hypothetical protein
MGKVGDNFVKTIIYMSIVRFEVAGVIEVREYHLKDLFNKNKKERKGDEKERDTLNRSI